MFTWSWNFAVNSFGGYSMFYVGDLHMLSELLILAFQTNWRWDLSWPSLDVYSMYSLSNLIYSPIQILSAVIWLATWSLCEVVLFSFTIKSMLVEILDRCWTLRACFTWLLHGILFMASSWVKILGIFNWLTFYAHQSLECLFFYTDEPYQHCITAGRYARKNCSPSLFL